MSRSKKTNIAIPGLDAPADPSFIGEDTWQLGLQRQKVVLKLLSLEKRSTADVEVGAKELDCSVRTMWSLLASYRKSPKLTSLIPKSRNGGRGKSRLLPEVDEIIDEAIREFYLKTPHALVSHLVREVHSKCHFQKLPKPAIGSINARLNKISKADQTRKKRGAKEARDIYGVMLGKTPDTQYPLQRVQIDHTRFDGHVVDSVYREPIGRPWITIFQDEFSRAVIGYYLTLEHPKTGTLAIGIAHSVLPKDTWAKDIGLKFEWLEHGLPELFYTDNAKEFVTPVVARGCQEWGMRPPEQRPKRFAHFGGIIERSMLTAMQEARMLPGATASNPKDKGDYDAEGQAVMTLQELDLWLATYFAGEYNNKIHSHTGLPPSVMWKKGFEDTPEKIGLGGPRICDDPQKLLIDFLPQDERKIKRTGIQFEYSYYWHDAMQYYLDRGDKRYFVIKYDPRDISSIWFLNPLDGTYYKARARDAAAMPVTLWDWKAQKSHLRQEGRDHLDADMIYRAYENRKDIVAGATTKTKRKKALKKKERTKQARLETEEKVLVKTSPKPDTSYEDLLEEDDFLGDFPDTYDIEEWS